MRRLKQPNSLFKLLLSALVVTLFLVSCSSVDSKTKKQANPTAAKIDSIPPYKRKPLDSLTMAELWERYKTNPCYLPLIKDSNLWEKGTRVGFDPIDLVNDSLPANHTYANRYLVGDFNAIQPDGTNKRIEEVYPKLSGLFEFSSLPKNLVDRIDTTAPGSAAYQNLMSELDKLLGSASVNFKNFLEKVWKYKMVPIKREYSIENGNVYAAGHAIVLCESCKDTIYMRAKFGTSPKRQDIASTGLRTTYYEYFPTGKRRHYYAGLNRITSKNWETERKFDSLDIARDNELGGGNNRITFYKGNVELPNFLLVKPSPEYTNAMHSNGIHEVALRNLARGMLGTANSIGCLRVSDFGAKYLRWWVPQNCKFFISYNDTLYHKKIDIKDSLSNYLPFKSVAEGDSFRKWLNTYKPQEAKSLEIGLTGDYRNGYIIDGYYYFKDEYNKFLKTKRNDN